MDGDARTRRHLLGCADRSRPRLLLRRRAHGQHPQLQGSDIASQLDGCCPDCRGAAAILGPRAQQHRARGTDRRCLLTSGHTDRCSSLATPLTRRHPAAERRRNGLEDGLVLRRSLASEPDLAQAMARFQARRRPRTEWVPADASRDRTRKLQPPYATMCCADGDATSSGPTTARCSGSLIARRGLGIERRPGRGTRSRPGSAL